VVITNEHYNRIARLLAKDMPVTLEFDLGAKFTEPPDSFNLTAEIPGTDPNAGIVMLGGHSDSWSGGTGATDNGAGSAIALEAIRIRGSRGPDHPQRVHTGPARVRLAHAPLQHGRLRPSGPGDMEQASAVMAWFVYNTANRPDMLPRKPMPKPGAGRGAGGGRGQ
jgi:hypothetical protein